MACIIDWRAPVVMFEEFIVLPESTAVPTMFLFRAWLFRVFLRLSLEPAFSAVFDLNFESLTGFEANLPASFSIA